MAVEVRMAKLSPTMETGTINRWLKKEGDKISSGDTLAEVETDKASMPLEAFDDGKLLKILAAEGSTVKVDELIAVLGAPGEDISKLLAGKSAAPAAAKAAPAAAAAPARVIAAASAPAAAVSAGPVKASPLAKKVAAEKGVDLRTVQPSGPGGRIIERDVLAAAGKPAAAAPAFKPVPLPAATGAASDVPLSNLRQTIARRLLQSKQTIPHWYCFAEVRMERALQLREDLNAGLQEGGIKISLNDLILKVCAAALMRHPEVNASFNETSIRRHGTANIAVAVATEDGLYTPVLRSVENLSLSQINTGVRELARKAREKKLQAGELSGSSFTVSNLGMFGVDHFFAIINPPDSAILAVGAVQPRPVVDDAGQVVAGKVMSLSLSSDHRVVDGAVGAKFLSTIKDLLEHPAKLLW